MNKRIARLANAALAGEVYPEGVVHAPESITTSVDIGNAIKKYLEIQPIELRENEFLVDRYRFFHLKNTPHCFYRGQFGKRGEYWYSLCNENPGDMFYWGWTHIALDFEYLLNNGLEGYYKRIESAKAIHLSNPEKLDFLEGMKICLDGIIARYKIYQKSALALAEECIIPERKKSLLRLADTFSRIPLKPANSFFDAVQLTWIGFLIAPDSLGRIDQYLLPYYRKGLEDGELTYDYAFELLEELFIKVHETQAYNPLDISGHNHLVVGGYLKDGSDGFNELSKVILEAIADLPTYRPQVSFRYTKYSTPETMRYITEMNKRSQLIVFVNDEPRIKGMIACGIDKEDAINYSVIGCNEWAIIGKSKLDLAHISLMHSVEKAIYDNGIPKTYEEFYNTFRKELKIDFCSIIDEYTKYGIAQEDENNLLSSIFHNDCIHENITNLFLHNNALNILNF